MDPPIKEVPQWMRRPAAIALVLLTIATIASALYWGYSSEARQEWAANKDTTNACIAAEHARRYPWALSAMDAREKAEQLGGCGEDERSTDAPAKPPTSGGRPSTAAFKTVVDCEGCPALVRIPAGHFMAGSPPAEFGRDADEQQKPASVAAVMMSQSEITVGEFARFARETDKYLAPECIAMGQTGDTTTSQPQRDLSWRAPGYTQADDFPVVCIDHTQALAYTAWLSAKTQKAYRLPTQDEWEFAARGGAITAYAFGPALTNEQARFREGDLPAPTGAVRIKRYAPNTYGLFDMHGNVWEWTSSCLTSRNTQGNDCLDVMIRGGSWNDPATWLRSANRSRRPYFQRANDVGFRVVREDG